VEIGDGCNVQENCVIHAFPGVTVVLEESAHLGHGSIVHGARIGKNALIGMNAVVMDRCVIGAGAIVGALSLVREGTEVPERMIAAGNPARIIKPVSDEMLTWKTEGTQLYQSLPAQLHATLKECEPLRNRPAEPPTPRGYPRAAEPRYETWKQRKSRDAED
jgi:carbonic anhydrase/acetyltransferase-like protein (isoleucine patch superfamily)